MPRISLASAHIDLDSLRSDEALRFQARRQADACALSRVELQVDDGPWQEAALRTPLSDLTWVVWRYEWPFDDGKHTFRVRCYEGNGTLQIASPSPVEPSGATGLYSRTEMF